MARARFQRPTPLAGPLAVKRAAEVLRRAGYETSSTSDAEVNLLYVKGSALSHRLDLHRHLLRITHEGAMVVFEFSSGLGGGGEPTGEELAALEERVTSATQTPPGAGGMIGCRFCGQLTDSAAVACEQCGAEDFR